MKDRILGLQKNIFFLGLTSLFNDFSSEMVFAVFPAFFTTVLHAGAESLGLVDGVSEAASNFFKIYSGHFSDRSQKRKPFLVFGYGLSVLVRPFYIFVSSVGGALGLRFTDRVGKGLRDAPRDAIISLSVSKEELGRSFGYHRAMDTIGAILGPLTAYLLLRYFPLRFDIVFLTAFAVGIIALFTLVFISDVAGTVAEKRSSVLAAFGELSNRFKLFLLATFILAIGSLPVSVVLLKTESLGLMVADIPLFFMIYSISYATFSYSAGKVSDQVGARTIIMGGFALLIVSYFMLNAAENAWALALGFFVFGLFPALTDGTQRSLASQLTAEYARGGGLGWLNAVNGFGALVAGIGGGFLWQAYGVSTAFMVAAVIVVIGMVLLAATALVRE